MIKKKRIIKNRDYCVIGIGKHASEKIIPALEKSGKRILGIVSRNPKTANRGVRCFKNLDCALNQLPMHTVFVICTPPNTHFKLLVKILKKKRDVIVEKPIFTRICQAKKAYYLIKKSKNYILEAYMYKHTIIYQKFKNYILSNFKNINIIQCTFTIPEIPKSTFRSEKDIRSSCLYDMGCYIIDLFVGLNMSLKKLKVLKYCTVNHKIVSIKFVFYINNILIKAKIGLGEEYNNFIKTYSNKNENMTFYPFFFGRSGNKNIENSSKKSNFSFYEKNAFEKMFKLKREIVIKDQLNSFSRIVMVNHYLEILSNEIMKIYHE